ncbi:MAG: hypothetical protein EBU08_14970 [Micrococcales bacterium]|nr:hypothetical protein [Micrococcales bacterium]
MNIVRTFIESRSKMPRIQALVDAKLWEIVSDNVVILSYSEYQFTKERVETERKLAAQRMAKSRESRRTNSVTSPEVQPPHPIPIPIPIPNIDIHTNPSDSEFNLFWAIYPRKEAKGAARTAFMKACKKVSVETIIEGAKRFANDPNRQPEFTAHASTWLNQERWADNPLPQRGGGMTRTESSVMRALEIAEKFIAEEGKAIENEPF